MRESIGLSSVIRFGLSISLGVSFLFGIMPSQGHADGFSQEDLDFFERKIRPVMVSSCFDCHSNSAEKLKGGLMLDSRADLLAGGDSGAAAVTGNSDLSLLIEAIEYEDVDLQMPPKSRLSRTQITDFRTWIEKGLPWPEETAPSKEGKRESFDLAARRASHWAWRPVEPVSPPEVQQQGWIRNPVDSFVLRRLEGEGMAPAVETNRRNLLRRLAYSLTGLPPAQDKVASFNNAYNLQAYDRLVDEFLASPQFGERWGRHWLDLVRYAETMGHEFDYTIPNAWRYRDYLVRAFNQDVPYDQFVKEHIAGDLVSPPRIWAETGLNESVTGTGFYWLGQQVHSPVDIEMNKLDMIDNQIDVLSKTFLGMTVSCARCHDHKFDAISTKDFYSFYGALSSSRYHEAAIDSPVIRSRSVSGLRAQKAQIQELAVSKWATGAAKMERYAMTGIELLLDGTEWGDGVTVEKPDVVFEDFELPLNERWTGKDDLFALEVSRSEGAQGGRLLVSRSGPGEKTNAVKGELLSALFEIERDYVHFLIAGGADRRRTAVRLLVAGKTVRTANGQRDMNLRPVQFDVREFRGQEAQLQVLDSGEGEWGFVAIDHIVFSQREQVFGKENRLLPSLESIMAAATSKTLNPVALRRWIEVLDESLAEGVEHPLFGVMSLVGGLAKTADLETKEALSSKQLVSTELDEGARINIMADVEQGSFDGWFFDGPALEDAKTLPGELVLGLSEVSPSLETEASIHSARYSKRLQGSLRSPTFAILDRYLHVLASGESSRINVVIDNFNLIRSPIYGGLKKRLNHTEKRWVIFDLKMWQGHNAYLELKDTRPGDLAGGGGYGDDGWFSVSRVVSSSENKVKMGQSNSGALVRLEGVNVESVEEGLRTAQAETLSLLDRWGSSLVRGKADDDDRGPELTRDELTWLAWLVEERLLAVEGSTGKLAMALESYSKASSSVRPPVLVPSMIEGSGVDHAVFVRGNPRALGDMASRGEFEALGAGASEPEKGSRRRELAEEIADPKNPLTARVYVNRVWHHIFGRGIVATTDNFGVLGQDPSHPMLLDWLAHWFVTEGEWSTKKLIRLLVTSSTFRMSSQADPYYDELDPTNQWFHKMPVRRLEGEAIRDAILQVSGELDMEQFGEPIPVHLTPFMTGRGRPRATGPLDGHHRRTIYQEVRRNFLSPMMLAFDAPIPHSTFGKRAVSNVPAQALILMNDPFVIDQAGRWAERLSRDGAGMSQAERVKHIYMEALGRQPTRSEGRHALEFISLQSAVYGNEAPSSTRPWADLCHVVFNVKEFIFLE
jgi:hypothetical protein